MLTGVLLATGCSGSESSTPVDGAGGMVAVGGAGSLGGATAVSTGLGGGSPTVGGAVAFGGETAAPTAGAGGGIVGNGGSGAGGLSPQAGGAPQSGGSPNVGGSMSKGGSTSVGTSSKGGATAKGGATSSGGAPSVGGTTSSGGATAKGGSTSAGGTTAKGGTTGAGGTTAAGGGSNCAFPTTFKWKDNGGPVANPGNGWVSIKDFTSVVYNNQHIVYMSMHDNANYGSATMNFADWPAAATATQTKMGTSTVAPELIYFTPKNTWVLSYQWCSAKFCYGTSTNPTSATSWSFGKSLLTENITTGSSTGPIDQVVICDATNCYLFYAGDNGHIYRASMPIGNFPGTFSGSTSIMQDTQANLFEAVEVYTIKGAGKYLMIVEAMGSGGRYFRAFTATSLGGSWTAISGAATENTPFAGKKNVTFTGTAWTNDISHGDLVRSHDETRTIDPCNLQLIYQGKNPSSTAAYDLLPYRMGLLTFTN